MRGRLSSSILRNYTVREGLTERVACICTDAMNGYFRPESFDLVVGNSILHHLFDPMRALTSTYSALRKGGIAVFLEPFEGCSLIGIAFELILDRSKREGLPLDSQLSNFLRAMCVDWEARRGTDKRAELYRHLDDKWLFTRHYLEAASRNAGFASLQIVPHSSHSACYREFVMSLLRVGPGLKPEILPDWAWDMIDLLDRSFTSEMKQDMLLEGTIVLRKGFHHEEYSRALTPFLQEATKRQLISAAENPQTATRYHLRSIVGMLNYPQMGILVRFARLLLLAEHYRAWAWFHYRHEGLRDVFERARNRIRHLLRPSG